MTKPCVHEIQRQHSHLAMMCCGKLPMSPDFALFGTIFEDDNVYHVEISDEYPGPTVFVRVGNFPLDRWPCLTLERAEARAARIVGLRPSARR
ncbi:hypothetical protein AX777_17710 [Sphingobium yanoikuyae]|uniref:Uncharacterized protein n=1 Tax=Sphingobium yanoikuyae TaxID=13690 RepID=A0A177JWF3_SPHYA|nr:hypothetical protein [Sphingobium yanoikuyae]OAH45443.1 hypothetical protein AX777_17710 [Sphingobium yanoikuyae]